MPVCWYSGRVTIVLSFPLPGDPPSINKMPRSRGGQIGWSKKRQAWRDCARVTAEEAMAEEPAMFAHLPPSTIQVKIPFDQERTRDPHNYTSTCVKWIVDGLVLAGLWADDNPAYLTILDPILAVDHSYEVSVTIEPREAA